MTDNKEKMNDNGGQMQAMIFAAGLGTRLKPLTDTMPKAMVKVGGEPLIKRVVEKLKAAGAGRVVVNVHHFANQIVEYLDANDRFGMDIKISDESDMLLDTGGGLKKAAPLFCQRNDDGTCTGAPILIHNVDIMSNVDLCDFYIRNIVHDAVLLVSERKTSRYLLFDDDMRLVGWTNVQTDEVKSPYPGINPDKYRKLAFSGIHIFSPRLFPLMDDFPDKFGIIDFYLKACAVADIRGYEMPGLRLLDVGKIDSLAAAEKFIIKTSC